ncbi:hypothetical protein V1512DRAFT_226004 [Lipomyces arxii]|uniref:uncharacterized protein n=1 Tax=Lipomyces arxii TaxID=56418 RepID=UPI0034CEB1AF
MNEYSSLPPQANVPFDFADCENFLARLEAEESDRSTYASSHSFSPDPVLSSGHGSSPLSSFSPLNNEDPNDSNSWGADTFLFPFDSNSTAMPMQVEDQVTQSPQLKTEYSAMEDPNGFYYADTQRFGTTPVNSVNYSSSFGASSTTSHNSLSSANSLSPASSTSSQTYTPPYKAFVPSPTMYSADATVQPSFQNTMPQQVINPAASMAASQKSTAAASKRSPQGFSQSTSRKTSASSRQQQYNDISPPEQGAKGGKIVKPKKTAHNMIEKRYRTNLNDKISALRDCVPALRCAVAGSFDDDEEELDGLAPASKLNKATVLTKATEYILHLQQRNLQLQRENKALLEGNLPQSMSSSPGSDNGMMGGAQMMNSQSGVDNAMGRAVNMVGNGRNMMGKLMMGSMAGMMVANQFNDVDGQNTRGLAAIPFMIRSGVQSALGPHAHAAFGLIRGVLLVGTLMYILYPSFFDNRLDNNSGKKTSVSFAAQPLSVSMPLEGRQQAWLTAIRTVDVPPRSTPLEILAIVKKLCKLAIRKIVGFDGYKLLINTTEEEHFVRTSAWKTAIDAQLCGGDADCSHVRLWITLLASFMIASSPVRAMMQALHVKILLHDVPFLQGFSTRLQRSLWDSARKLQQFQQEQSSSGADFEKIPEHIVHLLQCDDVFEGDTAQHAYNLAWNQDPGLNCKTFRDDGLDSMLEDYAIKSPLDALAGWYSCGKLRGVLLESLDGEPDAAALDASVKVAPPDSVVHRRALIARSVLLGDVHPEYTREMMEAVREDVKLTDTTKKAVAPVAHTKPVRTVEVPVENVSTSAIESDDEPEEEEEEEEDVEMDAADDVSDGSSLLSSEDLSPAPDDVKTSVIETTNVVRMLSSPDIRVAIRCALVQTVLPSRPYAAEKLYSSLKVYEASDLGLLGFVAVLTTVRKMDRRRPVEKTSEDLIGRARIWIGGDEGEAAGVATETRRAVVKECVDIGLRLGGYTDALAEEDEGYATGE